MLHEHDVVSRVRPPEKSMSRFTRLASLGCWILAALPLAASQGAYAQAPPPPVFTAWLNALSAAGYGIVQGAAMANTAQTCATQLQPVFGTCFFNDPDDPYVTPLMPIGAGYADPYFGPMASQPLSNGTEVGQVFRLATTEAELAIINLPPAGAYFSYQTYVFSRLSSDYKHGAKSSSPDPARGLLFASFNNSTNNIDVARQSGLGFGQGTIAIVTTANAALASNLVKQFVAAGGNPNLIFVDPIGANVDPGLSSTGDDLINLVRYLVPMNPVAGPAWRADPIDNVLVYRIDQPAGGAIQRYPTEELLTKSFNLNEAPYTGDVAELAKLMRSWLAAQEPGKLIVILPAHASEQVSTAGVLTGGNVGPFCIKGGSNCGGDEMDTDSYRSMLVGELLSGQLAIVVGVDHTLSNNATMYSLAVDDTTLGIGVLGVAQANAPVTGFASGDMSGSAVTALQTLGLWSAASPQLRAAAPYLYVQMFTRGCTTQSYCNQPFTQLIALPAGDQINITERAYVLPGFPNGANPDDLVDPKLIW
jgi:hypothetical protein